MKKSGFTMNKDFDCGFAITTTPGEVVEDNARDEGIKLTSKDWERFNEDFIRIEKNVIKYLEKKYGIRMREEGHDSCDDLVGTCWIIMGKDTYDYIDHEIPDTDRYWLNNKQAKALKLMMDMQGTDVAIDFLNSYDGDLGHDIFKGCCRKIRRLVDVNVCFFGIEEKDRDIYEKEAEKCQR